MCSNQVETLSLPRAAAYLPGESAGNAGWYAAHTRSNFEKRVASELQMKGVEAYLPAWREVHRWKDRNKEVEVPLFPGYVFVRIAGSAPSQLTVLRTAGVVRILGS